MAEISGNQLANLSGKEWRTVKKRLDAAGIHPLRRERGADLYDSAAAFAAIFAPELAAGELDAVQERARRDKESADRLAIQNAASRGELVRLSTIESELAAMFGELKQNALGLPNKLAPVLAGLSAGEIRDRLDSAVYELLDALANYEPNA